MVIHFTTVNRIMISLLLLCGSLLTVDKPWAQADNNTKPVAVCAPERPVVFPGESVTLQVWVSLPVGNPLPYQWSVNAGTIKGEGSKVNWHFDAISPGSYQARVVMTGRYRQYAECSLTVTVGLPPLSLMDGGYETGRSILLPGQLEDKEKEYGLYSYLLFGSEPDDSSRARYRQAIIEYLKFPDVINLEGHGFKRKELNITYLLLEKPIPDKYLNEIKDRNYKIYPDIANWILRNYDYARARSLLRRLPENHRYGPYIVSFLQPLANTPVSPPYLHINMSSVTPSLVKFWIKYFLDQAAQEKFWDENHAGLFALKLRTLIGITAAGLPYAKKEIEEWIAWINKMT